MRQNTSISINSGCVYVPEIQYIWVASWQNQQYGMCAQRRLRSAWAFAQSDQSSLCVHWVANDSSFLHADSEDSNQTGRMPRLIWVFAGRKAHFVGFLMRRLIWFRSLKHLKGTFKMPLRKDFKTLWHALFVSNAHMLKTAVEAIISKDVPDLCVVMFWLIHFKHYTDL